MPINHRPMKLGLKPPRIGLKAPGLDRLGVPLPEAIPQVHWGRAVADDAWGMDWNDEWSDCTIAGVHHAQVLFHANSNAHVLGMSKAETVLNYRAVSGFDPINPDTDQGAVLSDVMLHWQRQGFAMGGQVDRIAGFVHVQSANENELRLAMQWFGAAVIGIALPLTAQTQDVWDAALGADAQPGTWGLHCILLTGYDPAGLDGVTWGAPKRLTWRFWRRYGAEAWAALSQDWIENSGASPAGIALNALQADLAEMTDV